MREDYSTSFGETEPCMTVVAETKELEDISDEEITTNTEEPLSDD